MRPLYLAGGIIATGLAAAGAFLPIVPTVPFLLVAVFCFARSNRTWEQRILDHPHWGPQVRDWYERRAIPRCAKYMAIGGMSAGVAFTYLTLGFPWAWISIAILVLVGPWIWTRNE
ncbi:YbaN family protein [Altererythrobacter sp. JGD-16]|uniref:YbaN family protein n=2 Tax=Altererythrobacter lutimaris TaxID=2743979 RepID=A0A850H6E8_9SPHN|nr:YbaN family protein [Altererythrobacter lutimaris]NVE93403.1 YbaN family protein [Altererythrobacter lutimaris]